MAYDFLSPFNDYICVIVTGQMAMDQIQSDKLTIQAIIVVPNLCTDPYIVALLFAAGPIIVILWHYY